MNILFIHQNFPGQFRAIAEHLASVKGNTVLALRQTKTPVNIKGVDVISYRFVSNPLKVQHPWLAEMEAKVLRAEAVADACNRLRAKGWTPDLVIAHPGWGEAMMIKDVFPQAKLICYLEYFYSSTGQDFNFDPEFFDPTLQSHAKLHLKNQPMLQALLDMDAGWTATKWQKSIFPKWAQSKIAIVHEGVDLDFYKLNNKARFTIAGKNITLTAKDEVITYASRSLEPVRGFHVFMRALPELLKRRPKAHVIIMGAHSATYGQEPRDAATWPEKLLQEVGAELDPKRVHFVGFLPREAYRAVLQVSKAHIYLTYPFILSWSVIEALACGAKIVCSDTPPLKELFTREDKPFQFEFFDTQGLIKATLNALDCTVRQAAKDRKRTNQMLKAGFSTSTQSAGLSGLIDKALPILKHSVANLKPTSRSSVRRR